MIYNQLNYEEIGERLKKLMKEKGLTQQSLSKKVCISEKTIRDYQRGNRIISTENLIALCNFFEVSTEFLLYGEESSNILSDEEPDLFRKVTKLPPHTRKWIIEAINDLYALYFLKIKNR